jgi:hypothetical protein
MFNLSYYIILTLTVLTSASPINLPAILSGPRRPLLRAQGVSDPTLMPPSGRSDGANVSKHTEREWKRSHGAIACAECRRSVSLPPTLISH